MSRKETCIPLTVPSLGEVEAEAVRRPILSGWVTQGPEVAAFEKEFARSVGAPYACAVSSCTAALHLALLAVGIRPGDEVVTVSHSFIATANSIRYCGALPVFVDIEPGTFNLNPAELEKAITAKTKAVLCVHQMGMPCDLRQILSIARRYNLPVVEDAACALGSEILLENRWERIGRPHGGIACFSFHPRKIITTGDGGILTTSRAEWDEKFRLLRQQGMDVSDQARHDSGEVIFESYPLLGYNYRMTDIQAALGREQLKRLPEIVKRRRFLAGRYAEKLGKIRGIRLPEEPEWARSNWQSYCIRLSDELNQQEVMQKMLDAGVSTRRGIMNAHQERAYSDLSWSCGPGPGRCGCPPPTCKELGESESARAQGLLLPLYPAMSESDQDRVAATLQEAFGRHEP